MVTLKIVHCHPGLTRIFDFWHSGTLALRAERQSARMSEINKQLSYGRETAQARSTISDGGVNLRLL